MKLNRVAAVIYEELRILVSKPDGFITYTELVRRVNANNALSLTLGPPLNEALGNVADYCREEKLAPLTAIVVQAGSKIPSDGYFKQQGHLTKTKTEQKAAWESEVKAARQERYEMYGG